MLPGTKGREKNKRNNGLYKNLAGAGSFAPVRCIL